MLGSNNKWDIISAKDIKEYVNNKKAIIIDIRDKEEYDEFHIETSINIPIKDINKKLNVISKYDIIILYCSHGNVSLKVTRKLSNKINSNSILYSVYGGIEAYNKYQEL